MSGLSLRNVVYGLLIATLAAPACGWHVCRCEHPAANVLRSPTADSAAPLRPCCAKRLAAKTAQQTAAPHGIKARCCCDEIRWNQSVAKITVDRGPEAMFPSELAFGDAVQAVVLPAPERFSSAALPPLRAGPSASVLLWNCRWQV